MCLFAPHPINFPLAVGLWTSLKLLGKRVWRDNCERIGKIHTQPAQLQSALQDAVSWKRLSLLVVFWKPALLLKTPWLFTCLFALTKVFYPSLCRSHCQQWENWKVSPRPGDQILCQSKCFSFTQDLYYWGVVKRGPSRRSNTPKASVAQGYIPLYRTDPAWVGGPRKYAGCSVPQHGLSTQDPPPLFCTICDSMLRVAVVQTSPTSSYL